jgi:hypothetical protein
MLRSSVTKKTNLTKKTPLGRAEPVTIVDQISAVLAVQPIVIRHPIGGDRWPVHAFELADGLGGFVFVEDSVWDPWGFGRHPVHLIKGPGEAIGEGRWRFPADPGHGRWGGPIIVEVPDPGEPAMLDVLRVRAWLAERRAFTPEGRARAREIASYFGQLTDEVPRP